MTRITAQVLNTATYCDCAYDWHTANCPLRPLIKFWRRFR